MGKVIEVSFKKKPKKQPRSKTWLRAVYCPECQDFWSPTANMQICVCGACHAVRLHDTHVGIRGPVEVFEAEKWAPGKTATAWYSVPVEEANGVWRLSRASTGDRLSRYLKKHG